MDTIFISKRIKDYTKYLLKIAILDIGYNNINDKQLELIILSCKIKEAVKVLKGSFFYTHHGNYGPLTKELQLKLNLELGILDIANNNGNDKHRLIEDIIRVNDDFIKTENEFIAYNKYIKDILRKADSLNDDFCAFVDKINHLHLMEKNTLRLLIIDDVAYHHALTEMNKIFQKYMQKIIASIRG